MTDRHPSPWSRRTFLSRGITLASLATTVPWFLDRTAHGIALPQGASPGGVAGVPEDHILVVVQLGGGNDGLNTIVPHGMDAYYRARPQLSIARPGEADGCLRLSGADGLGMHPRLQELMGLFDDGKVAVIQGVGYPNPNRSHFTSMDIWHTGRADAKGHGWIGRYFDCTCTGEPVPEAAIAIGSAAPPAMLGAMQAPIVFESERNFRWMAEDASPRLARAYAQLVRPGVLEGVDPKSHAAFLMRTALDAQLASDRIRDALAASPLAQYPQSELAGQMKSIASMIRAGLPTRVYYASIGGFDTHGNQLRTHGDLLARFAEAMAAFHADLRAQGNDGRVVTVVFSEFGRRVRENGSRGTDHGTAAPMFLIGTPVKGGVYGEHPSLTDLDSGDLKFAIDFRSVYASTLRDWMGADDAKILGKQYPNLALIRKA